MGEETAALKSSDRLSRDIASTRRRLEEDANALRSRISAKEFLRPVRERVTGTLGEGGEKILEAFREHPLPLSLVGIGLGWLLLRDLLENRREGPAESSAAGSESATERVKGAAHRVGEAAGHAASAVSEKAGAATRKMSGMAHQATEAARKGAEKTADWLTHTLEDNPFALAVGAMAVGMVAGLVMPVTRKEEEALAKTGEKMANPAKEETPDVPPTDSGAGPKATSTPGASSGEWQKESEDLDEPPTFSPEQVEPE